MSEYTDAAVPDERLKAKDREVCTITLNIPYFFDHMPLLLFSLVRFVWLLFEGDIYFVKKTADVDDCWICTSDTVTTFTCCQ